jgi:hypothetical protein
MSGQATYLCPDCNYQKHLGSSKMLKTIRRIHNKTCPKTGRDKDIEMDNKFYLRKAYKNSSVIRGKAMKTPKYADDRTVLTSQCKDMVDECFKKVFIEE